MRFAALLMMAVTGFLGYRHIELSGKVLGVLLVCEVGIVLVINAAVIGHGGAQGLSTAVLHSGNFFSGAPGIALIFALAGYIGFEATAIEPVHAEEGRKPGRRELKGVIRDYYDSDLNPLFELEIDGRSILVPATEAFVARIDFDRRRIRLVLPEGLTDLDRHD